MDEFYNTDIIPKILKTFNVSNVIISGITDEVFLNDIFNYSADFTQINTNDENCIKGNPLEIFLDLENYGAIFIDDDPNWYTVFNELNIIKKSNNEFPLVFICNNKFPNKRRDSYLNPDDIPSEFRQKYMKKISVCFRNEDIIINDGFYHACHENTPKNGVLTAIEDFLEENNHIGLMKINFIKEISILYLKSQINEKRISAILNDIQNEKIGGISLIDKFTESQLLISYINENLNNYESEISKKDITINNYENKIINQNNKMNFKDTQISGFKSKLDLKDSQIKNIESKLFNKDRKIHYLETQLEIANNDINSMNHELDDKNIKIIELIDDSKQKDNQIKTKLDELNDKDMKLSYLGHCYTKQVSKMQNKEYCISCFKEEISNNKLEINYLKNNTLIKKFLSPVSYLYLILKSSPREISLNIKLYRALRNSKCFDIGFYLNKNKDLIESKWCKYFSPELHYVCNGFKENRTFNKKYFNRNSKKELLEYLLVCDK